MNQGILGQLSGKIGNVVGSSWKGIPVLKIYQPNVANPNTAGQQAQRLKFSAAVAVALANLTLLIQPFWGKVFNYMSGFNAFIKVNISAFDSLGVFIPANFKSSKGTLTAFDTYGVTASGATDDITSTWIDNSGTGNASASDVFHCTVFNATTNEWITKTSNDTRSAAASVTNGGTLTAGDLLKIYPFFVNATNTKQCDSDFVAIVCGA